MPDRSLGQEVWILGQLHTQLQLLRHVHEIINHQRNVRAAQVISRLVIISMPSYSYHRDPLSSPVHDHTSSSAALPLGTRMIM